MEPVLRAIAVYAMLIGLIRIAGNRSVDQVTTFDLILLLVIAQAIQQAVIGYDYSVTNAFIIVATIVGVDTGLSVLKRRWPRLGKVLDGVPLVIVEEGRLLHHRMRREGVDVHDILVAGRRTHGLERLDQIKYAVLERSGGITIVPYSKSS